MKFQSSYESAWADGQTLLELKTGTWRDQRPVTDPESCVTCGSCEIFCPTGSISIQSGHLRLELEYCKGCGICQEVCPSRCIRMEKETF